MNFACIYWRKYVETTIKQRVHELEEQRNSAERAAQAYWREWQNTEAKLASVVEELRGISETYLLNMDSAASQKCLHALARQALSKLVEIYEKEREKKDAEKASQCRRWKIPRVGKK